MPSPPQTNTSSAPSSSARWTRSGANLLFGTSDQIRIGDPGALRASRAAPRALRRSSCPAWAITATFFIASSSPSCGRSRAFAAAAPAARAANTVTHERAEAHEHSRGDVGEVVHAAVASATSTTNSGMATASDHSASFDGQRSRSARRARAAGRRRARPTRRCGPTGSSRRRGGSRAGGRGAGRGGRRASSPGTCPDSTQITNSVNAASRQRRITRKTTSSTPTTTGITSPPASVEPTHERSTSVGRALARRASG